MEPTATSLGELFRQIAFISAVLGGFSFSFLSVLLNAEREKRILDWSAGFSIVAAACFVVSTFAATSGAIYLAAQSEVITGTLPRPLAAIYNPMIFAFVVGVFGLILSLGLSGWMRSKAMGIVSSVTAAFALIAAIYIVILF